MQNLFAQAEGFIRARLATWGAGIWVVAVMLGFDAEVLSFLDSLAVPFGMLVPRPEVPSEPILP